MPLQCWLKVTKAIIAGSQDQEQRARRDGYLKMGTVSLEILDLQKEKEKKKSPIVLWGKFILICT